MIPTSQWYTVQQVAAALQVAEQTVYNMCKRGEIRHKHVGRLLRVHISAIEEDDQWAVSSKGKVLKVPFGTSS